MTEYEFIQEKLYPLLSAEAKASIRNYTSSRFDIEPCIKTLEHRGVKLRVELENLQLAISRLKMIK